MQKVKMKIIETFFLFNIAAAQGNSIEGRILKVEEKCGLFMDKALICVPPEVKKSKYTHRLNKVMRDAKWHKVSSTCIKKLGRLSIKNWTVIGEDGRSK